MTSYPTRAVTHPMDARTFLLGTDSVAELGRRIRAVEEVEVETNAGGALPQAARRLLDDNLAAVAAPFLDRDLGAAALAGWQKHEELRAAARKTAADPDLMLVIPLAGHTITSTWRPRIDITLGDARVGYIGCSVVVALAVTAVSATVEAGRLTHLGAGRCVVTASFTVGSRTLARESAAFDPQLAVSLGDGISLIGAATGDAATSGSYASSGRSSGV